MKKPKMLNWTLLAICLATLTLQLIDLHNLQYADRFLPHLDPWEKPVGWNEVGMIFRPTQPLPNL